MRCPWGIVRVSGNHILTFAQQNHNAERSEAHNAERSETHNAEIASGKLKKQVITADGGA